MPLTGARRTADSSPRSLRPYRLLTVRAVAVALVALLLLDVWLRVAPPPFPESFRFPKVTTQGFDEYVDFMAREDRVRVAVVGDSVTQGLFVDRADTQPAFMNRMYAEQGRDVRAYNLGISAAHPNDDLAVVSHLIDSEAADVIVIAFSYHFFLSRASSHDWDLRYPQLWRDPEVFAPIADEPGVRRYLNDPDVTELPFTDRMSERIGGIWRLYGSRDAYAAMLFDTSAPLKFQEQLDYSVLGKKRPVIERPALEDFNLATLSTYFDGRRLDLDSAPMRYLQLTLQVARDAGIPVVVVANPTDVTVLEYHDLMTAEDYRAEMDVVRAFVEAEGADFVDLGVDFPFDTLADTMHPVPAGYEVMAERTIEAVEPHVRRAEDERLDRAGGDPR